MIETKPFQPMKLEEERDENDKKVSVRINQEEAAMIKEDQELFQLDRDSTTIKLLMKLGHNVIHGKSNAEIFRWIASDRRQRRVI